MKTPYELRRERTLKRFVPRVQIALPMLCIGILIISAVLRLDAGNSQEMPTGLMLAFLTGAILGALGFASCFIRTFEKVSQWTGNFVSRFSYFTPRVRNVFQGVIGTALSVSSFYAIKYMASQKTVTSDLKVFAVTLSLLCLVGCAMVIQSLAQFQTLALSGSDEGTYSDDEMTKLLGYRTQSSLLLITLIIPGVLLIINKFLPLAVETVLNIIVYSNAALVFLVQPFISRYILNKGIN